MSNAILRPSSTTTSSNATPSGSASLHAAMSDDNESTFALLDELSFGDGSTWVGGALTDLTLPAGAVIRSAGPLAHARTSLGGILIARMTVDGVDYGGSTWVSQTLGPVFFTSTQNPEGAWVEADFDAATYWVQGWQLGGNLQVTEFYVVVIYVTVPELSVTGPTGTFTTNNRPAVTWTPDHDLDGGDPTYFEVKVYDDATYGGGGFDPDSTTPDVTSGIVAGNPQTWTPPAGLVNDTYRAYVRIAQTVNGELHWSDWEFSGFTVNTPAPATPTLTLTQDVANARVVIGLAGNAGSATTDGFLVERSLDAGDTWELLRQVGRTDGAVLGAPATVYDYEAPLGREVDYRAYAVHDYTGVLTPSLAADTDSITLAGTSAWLKCPQLPELNLAISVHSFAATSRVAKQTVVDVLGRQLPVIVGDGFGGQAGTLVVQSWSRADRDALMALLYSGATLLLQLPDEWDPEGEDVYLRANQMDRARLVDKARVVDVLDTLAWVEVQAPSDYVVAYP